MWKGYPPWKGFGAYGLAWAIGMSWKGGILRLRFDAQTGSFSVGNIVTGGTSGSTGRIVAIQDDGADGVLTLDRITGPFLDDEIVYESALGSETVTNSDMELDSDWIDTGVPTTNERSAVDKHGGTYSRHAETDNSGWDGFKQNASGSLSADNFYKIDFWYKVVSGSLWGHLGGGDPSRTLRGGKSLVGFNGHTDSVWTQSTDFYLFASGNSGEILFRSNSEASEFYVDDVSIKQITNAALAKGVLY